MPQGQRKVAFSHKKKKQQLSEKKQSKVSGQRHLIRKIKDEDTDDTEVSEDLQHQINTSEASASKIQKINVQKEDSRSKNNRYVLQFHRETNSELKEMKEEARKALEYVKDVEGLEIDDVYFQAYDFPIRPTWTYEMSKLQVESNENRYFFQYITALEKRHYDDMKPLSCFELNLETWRQLWRVLELSDVLLLVVDARFPSLMFPPALYTYINEVLNKKMILVINKIDLVSSDLVLAWKKYFEEKYPHIKIVLFTSFPSYNMRGHQENASGLKIRRRRGRMRMVVEGAQQVYKICKEIVGDAVDLKSWEAKINEESQMVDDNDCEEMEIEKTHEEEKLFDFEEIVAFKDGTLTIGCLGFPNAGKSSLLNALMGKKVVSVSRTPGHTKHFQTIFLTNTVRLCDCPGLVFPSCAPRKLQVLIGSYPIAQLREPYGAIKYLAERIDLVKLLVLTHPDGEGTEWSALDICDAWAIKRGFLTAKAARPDTYRSANSILRMALDGKLTLSLAPVGFARRTEYFKTHPELEEIERIQALSSDVKAYKSDFVSESEEEEDEEKPGNVASNRSTTDEDESGLPAASTNPFDLLTDE